MLILKISPTSEAGLMKMNSPTPKTLWFPQHPPVKGPHLGLGIQQEHIKYVTLGESVLGGGSGWCEMFSLCRSPCTIDQSINKH